MKVFAILPAVPKHAASVPRQGNFLWIDQSSVAIMIAKRRCNMAQILVRDIEDDVKERLQRRAARHGHSMEAEIRDILRDVVKADMEPAGGLGTEIAALFRGIGLQRGEEIPELRGFTIKNVFEE
jgi:plasmid stability protein